MARFRFKLEVLLEARRREERDHQRIVAERHAVVVAIERQIEDADLQIQQSMQDVRAVHLGGKLDLGYLAGHRRFVAALHRRKSLLAQKLSVARDHHAQAQGRLIEAAKRRKALEKLREKHLSRWQLEQEEKDRRSLDEIGMRIAYENLTAEVRP
jgi:flagellar protein FliJ